MMDLNEIPIDPMVIEVVKFDGKYGGESQTSGNKGSEAIELRCREIEEKCLAFELEIQKKSIDLEVVQVRTRALECEKVAIEKEIEGLKKKKAALEGAGVDETSGAGEFSLEDWKMDDDEESKIDQLMVVNKVLKCQKNSALREAELWKGKCKELELRLLELEGRLSCHGSDFISSKTKEATENGKNDVHASRDLGSSSRSPGARYGEIQSEGTPCIGSPRTTRVQSGINVKRQLVFRKESSCDRKIAPSTPAGARSGTPCIGSPRTTRVQSGINVKRQLVFRKESSCDRKIAPSTPAGARSGILIDIVDSDDERDIPEKHRIVLHNKGTPFIGSPKRKQDPIVLTRKRKFKIDDSDNEVEDDDDIRPVKQVFNSGDTEKESDDDDNIPISQLVMNRASRADNVDSRTRTRRRLVKSQQGENSPGNLAIENVELEDDDWEEDGLDSDAGSLSSFIVDDDDDVEEEDGTDDPCKPEDSSDDDLDYKKIISRLQSRRNPNSKWDLEGEMLSAFGKDPELCMRAVCALYRQQTSTEKLCKESLVQNGRGFSKFDAPRGTELGEFLTGGDPNGDLVKSMEELQEHDPNGLEKCCTLARHYSKQLFEIYENEEDPFFP